MLRAPLFARFGADRVLAAPISESAFFGAAAGAAMAGLRPVVELYMVDFIAVAFDAVLNHIAKLEGFSGGGWNAPLVIRAPSGGWYGDGGQHGQSLWGSLASIPGGSNSAMQDGSVGYWIWKNGQPLMSPARILSYW